MARQLVLDAMIRRADFWQRGKDKVTAPHETSARHISTIALDNLKSDSSIVLSLRKPDFQRETNQWSPSQAVIFIKSFIDGDLVPSIILWASVDGLIFVIDGAHRISALRAWIEDDYGDGATSISFFNGEIPAEQKKAAKAMRLAVEREIGTYKSYQEKNKARANNPSIQFDEVVARRLGHIITRQLDLQWVTGNEEVAEASFFKINTQGTPLDKTEEKLLRNRNRSHAIAARSIIRAATGHKYWSKFDEQPKADIETLSSEINNILFHPELTDPIKTIQLPIAGSASTLDSLSLLMRLLAITDGTTSRRYVDIDSTPTDETGTETIKTLKNCLNTIRRISGNQAESLGLHPAVYFYSDRGKYLPDMFLGISYLFKESMLNNDGSLFKKFTAKRLEIEAFVITNKPIISQILQQIRSSNRIERAANIFDYLIKTQTEFTIEGVAEAAGLKGSILELGEKVQGRNFNDTSRAAILIRDSLRSAMKCPICKGSLEPALSASYDHIVRKQDGGDGSSDNGQIVHPYCNTGIKN